MRWSTGEGFRDFTREFVAQASAAVTCSCQSIRSRTYTSSRKLGVALMQEHDGKYYPVAYGNKKLTLIWPMLLLGLWADIPLLSPRFITECLLS